MVSLMVYPIDLGERTQAFAMINVPMDEPLKNGSRD
jgi:hypothetical protein